jgi:hypothetical protein
MVWRSLRYYAGRNRSVRPTDWRREDIPLVGIWCELSSHSWLCPCMDDKVVQISLGLLSIEGKFTRELGTGNGRGEDPQSQPLLSHTGLKTGFQ